MNDASRNHQLRSGEPTEIAALVQVAPGATVSRVLVRSGGGSVTLFAFAGGQELSEHTAPFDALVHVIEGHLLLTIGGRPVSVEGGGVVLMPARVPHALRAERDTTMILTMLRDAGRE